VQTVTSYVKSESFRHRVAPLRTLTRTMEETLMARKSKMQRLKIVHPNDHGG
jgi:hypothetical protein